MFGCGVPRKPSSVVCIGVFLGSRLCGRTGCASPALVPLLVGFVALVFSGGVPWFPPVGLNHFFRVLCIALYVRVLPRPGSLGTLGDPLL